MTAAAVLRTIETLTDAMFEALQKATSTSTRELSRWVAMHYRKIFDGHIETLALEGLDGRFRTLRKKQASRGKTIFDVGQLCLDLGIKVLDLDDEVSVPVDMSDLANSECDWVEIDDVTADHVRKHKMLLRAVAADSTRKSDDYEICELAMLRIGKGRTDIPMHELRKIAKGQ